MAVFSNVLLVVRVGFFVAFSRRRFLFRVVICYITTRVHSNVLSLSDAIDFSVRYVPRRSSRRRYMRTN